MQPTPPSIPVQIGDVLLGKYVVEKVIGAGGMGVVVAVRHRELGELYAMKFMLPAALANDQAVERFVREARAAAKLKSEHVASVHDVGRLESGSPYMVMEHLTGQDLEQVVEKSGVMAPAIAATYVMQACDAIAEAHDAGIVHRDLKPANLFLTKRPSGSPCIKVLDFGISKSVNPDEQANSMTRTTAIMGSPYYMSPEQMRSSKNVDARTDIWALGVILYQLTTGRVPFPGDTITEVCAGVLSEELAPLTPIFPNISPEFEAIIRRCLAKRPEHRFQSARELQHALAAVAGVSPGTSGLDLPRPVVTMAMQAPPPANIGPTQAGAPAPHAQAPHLGLAPAAVPGQAAQGPGATQAGWGTTQARPKSSSPVAALALVGALLLGGGAGGYYYFFMRAPAATNASSSAPSSEPEAPAQTATATAAPSTEAPAQPEPEATGATSAEPEPSAAPSAADSSQPIAEHPAGQPKTKTPASTKTATPTTKSTSAPVAQPTSKPTGAPTGHGIL
jgi:serine/threonine-protein kinase